MVFGDWKPILYTPNDPLIMEEIQPTNQPPNQQDFQWFFYTTSLRLLYPGGPVSVWLAAPPTWAMQVHGHSLASKKFIWALNQK